MVNRENSHHCYAGDIFAKMRDIVFSPICLIKRDYQRIGRAIP